MAVVTVAAALFWGAVSGSGPATRCRPGDYVDSGLAAAGYPKPFAAALTSAASGLAIIIPPVLRSLFMAIIPEILPTTLFAAGIIPGIVVGLALAATAYFISRNRGYR